MPPRLYHITTRAAWDAAASAGSYRADSLDTEGFIHLSTEAQVPGTRSRWFAGRTGLVLLVLDASKLGDVRFEPVRDDRFPHLYGPIPLAAVLEARPIDDDA